MVFLASLYSTELLDFPLSSISLFNLQAEEREHVAVLAEEGAVPPGRLLLEEAQGRQDDEGGPHEAQSAGHGGERANEHVLSFYYF